mmetsp:Transcript_90154/g.188511  ORF Transcript_90154/g.188511 Transcript_90154/m.188511 type:complete len:205 (+) Transcript_90154:117-731(+)
MEQKTSRLVGKPAMRQSCRKSSTCSPHLVCLRHSIATWTAWFKKYSNHMWAHSASRFHTTTRESKQQNENRKGQWKREEKQESQTWRRQLRKCDSWKRTWVTTRSPGMMLQYPRNDPQTQPGDLLRFLPPPQPLHPLPLRWVVPLPQCPRRNRKDQIERLPETAVKRTMARCGPHPTLRGASWCSTVSPNSPGGLVGFQFGSVC